VADLKASGIQIVSSIIGSSLLLFAITTFYSDYVNKPDIRARVVPNGNAASIELTNNGRVPATNLILIVKSSLNIADSKIFATENWTKKFMEENQTLIAQFPRFVHGDGSLIAIEIPAEQKPNAFNQNYAVYVTYDQGSLKLESQMQQPISIPFGLTIAFTIAALITFTIPYFYRRAKRNRQHLHNELISKIVENIFYLKEYFERKPSDTSIMNGEITSMSKRLNDIKGIFRNEMDFRTISQFYTKLVSRNIELQRNANKLEKVKDSVESQNFQIAEIARKVLDEIHWEEYDVNMIDVIHKVSHDNYQPSLALYVIIGFQRYNMMIEIIRPMLTILIIPIVLTVGSFVISGNPVEWIQGFEIHHWLLLVGAIFLGILVYLSRFVSLDFFTALLLLLPLPSFIESRLPPSLRAAREFARVLSRSFHPM
jgi:hypothetical protein